MQTDNQALNSSDDCIQHHHKVNLGENTITYVKMTAKSAINLGRDSGFSILYVVESPPSQGLPKKPLSLNDPPARI